MSSAICQNFVQNAWKKDLCSNCFKSKDEHNLQTPSKLRSNQITVKKSIGGIIKSKSSSSKRPKRSVGFTKQLIEVIGFGGEDSFSDSEEVIEDEEEESDEETEEVFEGDAEKELSKLTKANTEFNANLPVNVEVNGTVETKKSYTQLLLGKPQLDSEGKKQTLLVSVTPFGQTGSNNNNNNNNVKKYNGSVSHIPVAKSLPKENLLEPKGSNYAPSNVILTSYTTKNPEKEKSLLDEISETLENSKNPIQIISNPTNNRKKSETELILSKPDFDNNNKENVDDSKTELKPKSTDSIPEIRKNSLSRTPVIKKDQEKPTIYQTSTAKIDLITTKSSNAKSAISSKETKPTETLIKNDPIVAKIDSDKEKKQEEVKEEEISDASLTSTVSSCEESDRSCEEESAKIIPELVIPSQNREQPDGQADVEETEPPALPLTPPPNFDSTHNNSFLHGQLPKHQQQPDKPKIPCKPSTILIRKQLTNNNSKISPIDNHPPPILTTFISSSSEALTKPKVFSESLVSKPKFVKLEKQDSGSNKRKAPKPPNLNEDLELNKRNLNLGKFDDVCINSYRGDVPEPLPRRSLSLSSDNLLSQSEEKKKRARFSLKKFLRMGNNSKNLNSNHSEIQQKPISEEPSIPPQIKPRLVIVHPSELNGDKVEVLSKNLQSKDVPDYSNSNLLIKSDVPKPSMKPAPPPRNYDDYNNPKPNLPHPPKSQEIINKQKEFLKNPNIKKTETVYANIGEVRSALTPNKPHRTASMREREAQQQKAVNNNNNNYENVGRKSSGSPSNDENYYDYINNRSSSPECDSKNINNNGANRGGLGQKSESNIDISSENYYVNHKYQMIPRSLSLTYCGSETESEIYSPYSFCGSESEVADDDHEQWILSGKTHKLRSKKGRSIVHKNLEDNYGAVVVANHEALAQVLENIQQSATVQPALRGLKTSPSLRWAEFAIKGSAQSVAVGPRAFHQAIWGAHHHVTLMVSVATAAPATSISPGVSAVAPITEFCDLVPVRYLPERDGTDADEDAKHLQATVAVLPWTQIHTIESYGELLKSKGIDEHWKDASFILLQLVNALKVLQAQGIEELPSSLSSFVLCREVDKDAYYRLYVLQGLGEDLIRKTEEEPSLTLCSCASLATSKLSGSSRISSLIQNLLKNERAVSLTQTKSVLEFSLWGPSDVSLSNTIKEREMALQRWLDLQRATVLHGLVCAKIQLNVYEECHLMFLVRSTARMMSDASLLVESSNKQK